jgi:hypothetical protein
MDIPINFIKNYFEYFQGIEKCIDSNFLLPALTLIYSGIDSMAWIAYGDISVRERYIEWIENYMYKAKKLKLRPIDLYAARCAILHTLTPDSDLSKQSRAKPLNYAYGNAKIEALERGNNKLGYSDNTCLHLNELYRLGVALFLDSVAENIECIDRMNRHYSPLSVERLEFFNEIKI